MVGDCLRLREGFDHRASSIAACVRLQGVLNAEQILVNFRKVTPVQIEKVSSSGLPTSLEHWNPQKCEHCLNQFGPLSVTVVTWFAISSMLE